MLAHAAHVNYCVISVCYKQIKSRHFLLTFYFSHTASWSIRTLHMAPSITLVPKAKPGQMHLCTLTQHCSQQGEEFWRIDSVPTVWTRPTRSWTRPKIHPLCPSQSIETSRGDRCYVSTNNIQDSSAKVWLFYGGGCSRHTEGSAPKGLFSSTMDFDRGHHCTICPANYVP